MKINFKLKGVKDTVVRIDQLAKPEKVRRAVDINTRQMEKLMRRKAVFSKGYSTRATKKSIRIEMREDGYTGAVMPMTEYAIHLEYGTRNMVPQSFVRPAMWEQKIKFINDMFKTIK